MRFFPLAWNFIALLRAPPKIVVIVEEQNLPIVCPANFAGRSRGARCQTADAGTDDDQNRVIRRRRRARVEVPYAVIGHRAQCPCATSIGASVAAAHSPVLDGG